MPLFVVFGFVLVIIAAIINECLMHNKKFLDLWTSYDTSGSVSPFLVVVLVFDILSAGWAMFSTIYFVLYLLSFLL